MDLTHLTPDEKINGIGSLKVPNYLRNKAHGQDVRETLAQLAEMIIQLGVNLSLDPYEALEWARKLQESVSQSEFDSWVATLLDGGPSLFFETKAALVAKHPNGAPGVALVRETDPAKIYVWNGTAWEDFGAYQGTEVKDGTVSFDKMTADLKPNFEEISAIADDLLKEDGAITNLTLTPFFDLFSAIEIVDGVLTGSQKTNYTSIVGGGLFNADVRRIQFKGVTRNRFVVLAFDGTYVYHFNISGNILSLKKHSSSSSLGEIKKYTMNDTVTNTDLVKVELKSNSIDVYVNDNLSLKIEKEPVTLEVFNNRVLGFLQVPNAQFLLTQLSFANPTTIISDIKRDIANLQNFAEIDTKIDLVMFMGQSNMGGRGTASEAPKVVDGAGFEFRAVSDPTKLYPIVEPFGVNENKTGGITEGTKTGSMVSAFANKYYEISNTPIVAVSASKGGSVISEWQPNGAYLTDAIGRYHTAENWLMDNGYLIKNKYMVWLQGESDGTNGTNTETYKSQLDTMVKAMISEGIEHCYLIRIGKYNGSSSNHDEIIEAQTELAKVNKNITLVSTKLASMVSYMKDAQHFNQAGLNILGEDTAINTSFAVRNDKEPVIYDELNNNLYFSYK